MLVLISNMVPVTSLCICSLTSLALRTNPLLLLTPASKAAAAAPPPEAPPQAAAPSTPYSERSLPVHR